MDRKGKIALTALLATVFMSAYMLLVGRGINILWIIPLALITLLSAVLSLRWFLLLTVFLVPLSVQLRFFAEDISADLFLPTEPMLALMLVLMLYKLLITHEIDRSLLRHPVTVILALMVLWGLFTSLTGTMPLVSLKSILARIWYLAGFYMLAAVLFSKREMIGRYLGFYIAGMIPVVAFFVINLGTTGFFVQKVPISALRPFFNDHTALGASLAICIPVLAWFIVAKGRNGLVRLLLVFLLILFSFAFLLTYSRAAWISLAAAAIVVALLYFRPSLRIIIPSIIIAAVIVSLTWTSVFEMIAENRQDSSSDLSKHLKSISNITTDASNMERMNRWKSALRMSSERPLLGWGPATYQFNYAPYQLASEKTIISTNYGEGGNAHSEYLGALVDSGIPGVVFYICLIATVMIRAIMLFYRTSDRRTAGLILMLIAGLTTYVVHGTMNNFLDTDKLSSLFWGMIAAVVAIDIRIGKENEGRVSEDPLQ